MSIRRENNGQFASATAIISEPALILGFKVVLNPLSGKTPNPSNATDSTVKTLSFIHRSKND